MERGMGTSVRPFVKHDQVVADDFRGKFLISFLIFPTAGSEAAFDIDKASFVKVFLGQFGQTTPKDYRMPFCLRDEFTGPILKCLGRCQGELGNGNISIQKLYV